MPHGSCFWGYFANHSLHSLSSYRQFAQNKPPNVDQFFFHFIAYWSLHYFVKTGTNLPNSTECELNPWLISLSKIIWFIPYQRLHELWSFFFFWLKMTVGSHATKLDCSGTSRGILALYGPKKELMMPITQIKIILQSNLELLYLKKCMHRSMWCSRTFRRRNLVHGLNSENILSFKILPCPDM